MAREPGVVVGDTAPAIKAAGGNGGKFGLDVSYLQREAPLGLAHGLLASKGFLAGDDFVMYLGDNFIVGGIRDLIMDFQSHRRCSLDYSLLRGQGRGGHRR